MAYIGNNLAVAYPNYRNIDDISASFNGSTTSFALLVNGAAPVPQPLNSQQCLISVGGVLQRPDDTGSEGFRLSGGNIIFSSAPATSEDFFGVVLAGADYVNAGANFPDGQVGAPSITFDQDNDTGFYRSGSGAVSFTSNGVGTATFGSASFVAPSFIPTSSTAPTNGVYLPAANSVAISTNSTERTRIDSSGRLLVGTSSSVPILSSSTAAAVQVNSSNYGAYAQAWFYGGNNAAGPAIMLAKSRNSTYGSFTVVQSGDNLGGLYWSGDNGSDFSNQAANILCFADGTPGVNDMPGRLVFSTTADGASSPTERMRITQAGNTFVNYSSSSAIENEVFGVQGATTLMGRFTNNTNTSGYNGIRTSIGSNGNNTSTYHFSGNTSGVNNWFLYGNGTTSYSSDERLKKNIETTRDGYLEDICQLRVVKYNWKNHDEATPKELGLIAQEVEQVFPGLVQDDLAPVSEDDPTIYKQLKGSVIPMILLKALQEAAEKIETLEARLTAAGIE